MNTVNKFIGALAGIGKNMNMNNKRGKRLGAVAALQLNAHQAREIVKGTVAATVALALIGCTGPTTPDQQQKYENAQINTVNARVNEPTKVEITWTFKPVTPDHIPTYRTAQIIWTMGGIAQDPIKLTEAQVKSGKYTLTVDDMVATITVAIQLTGDKDPVNSQDKPQTQTSYDFDTELTLLQNWIDNAMVINTPTNMPPPVVEATKNNARNVVIPHIINTNRDNWKNSKLKFGDMKVILIEEFANSLAGGQSGNSISDPVSRLTQR